MSKLGSYAERAALSRIRGKMIKRCHDPSCPHFKNYGARGITVCDEWRDSFDAFLRDVFPRPNGTYIDRIDNSRGYFKENVRWATREEQNRNRRSCIYILDGQENLTMAEYCRKHNLNYNKFYHSYRLSAKQG